MGERIRILFLVYAHQAIAPGHLSPVKAVNLTLQNPNQLPSVISVYFLAYSNKLKSEQASTSIWGFWNQKYITLSSYNYLVKRRRN